MSDLPKPTCPFCGAAPKENWTKKTMWFTCGTMVAEDHNRNDQTTQCVESEIGGLNQRIKRLEEAGDDLMIWRADPYSVALWRRAKEAKP